MTSYIKNQKAQPVNIRTNGSITQSVQAGVPQKAAVGGNSTGRGFDPLGMLRNWVFPVLVLAGFAVFAGVMR